MYLTVSMRLTVLAITCIGSAELNALPTDCCRISSLRLTMRCYPTRKTLILGGGFRTVAVPLLFSTEAPRRGRDSFPFDPNIPTFPHIDVYGIVGKINGHLMLGHAPRTKARVSMNRLLSIVDKLTVVRARDLYRIFRRAACSARQRVASRSLSLKRLPAPAYTYITWNQAMFPQAARWC
jgi:hypothetical protein